MKHESLPLNLQFFAEDVPLAGGNPPPAQPQNTDLSQNQNAQIDYEKLSQILEGKQAATEESVLKGYFKQQGLSKEEVEQAIGSFKEKKAAAQPNVEELKREAEAARKEAQSEKVKSEAVLMAGDLGIELKNVTPVLKLADLSEVFDKNGGLDKEKLKAALNKVLEEVPVFKTETDNGSVPQLVRGTGNTYKPQQTKDEKAYLNQKYKNNPYYRGNQ